MSRAFLPLVTAERLYDTVIIDGPWPSLPAGAGVGLALDPEWHALTLQTDPTAPAFLLMPAPSKGAFANNIWDVEALKGRLYIGYGDSINNRGPVDIMSYDPLCGELSVEMTGIPEEKVGGWYSPDGNVLYACGEDSQEDWTFGSFYRNTGTGWQKFRTLPKALHVLQLIEFRGRLYAQYRSEGQDPVGRPFVLVSDNGGVSWSYEVVDTLAVRSSRVESLAVVNHAGGSWLYAILLVWPTEAQWYTMRLYRSDGVTWEGVRISDTMGELAPLQLVAFKQWLLVGGEVTDGDQTHRRVYALDGQSQTELTSLRNTSLKAVACDIWNDQLYCLLEETRPSQPLPDFGLYRTPDGLSWERLGAIVLSPGTSPESLGLVHGRLYIGARNSPRQLDDPRNIELSPTPVYTLENASLHWSATTPEGAWYGLQVRSANRLIDLLRQNWVGPDGTEATTYTVSGERLHPRHNGHTYLQIAIRKRSNTIGQLPSVQWVTLQTDHGAMSFAVDEGQGVYAATNAYTVPAEYLSPIFGLRMGIGEGSKLFFQAATPPETAIYFQIRSGATRREVLAKAFVGPDGSTLTFYQNSGEELWPGHRADTYVQYRAVLESQRHTTAPYLHHVALITRSDRLWRFSLQDDMPSVWTAGQPHTVHISALSPNEEKVALQGYVQLSALHAITGEPLPVHPPEICLIEGQGTAEVVLERAVPTRIVVALGDVASYSSVLDVRPGAAASIHVTTDLEEEQANWSPVGQVGQPFSLSLTILDYEGNVAAGYTGTVRCECRRDNPIQAHLPPPYTFMPQDGGKHELSGGVIIDRAGEWNIACFDEEKPHIAGS
ncbi:MAG: hypothetical protein H5T69_15265, partial [Chloroflexi bacterium]|nr:hypothetical protein [Chloroflexota bacterium]